METEGFYITQNWDNDGVLVLHNTKTLDLYLELKTKLENADTTGMGIFFAFDKHQFKQGLASTKRYRKEGEKIVTIGGGCFGTREAFKKWHDLSLSSDKEIAERCDPQEVYAYEYNNHECFYSFDGDKSALDIVTRIWGREVLNRIQRY